MREKDEYPEREDDIHNVELERHMAEKIAHDPELQLIFTEESHVNNNVGNVSGMVNDSYLNSSRHGQGYSQGYAHKDKDMHSQHDWNFILKERSNKKTNDTLLDAEVKLINDIKYTHAKNKILKECQSLIDDFDRCVYDLKKEKSNISFYQKMGEFELLIKT